MEDVPTAVAAEPAQVWVGSGHVVRQSFGERRQWGGSYGPRFCSVYPLPRAWRPKADSRLPANRFRFAPMSPTGILWSTSRKPTKHAEAWLAEMDGRWPPTEVRILLRSGQAPSTASATAFSACTR